MVKKTFNKMNSHPSEWEKIFTSNISDKGLISKIYNELIQLNINKPNLNFKKMDRGCEETFFQGSIQMSNRHEKILKINKHDSVEGLGPETVIHWLNNHKPL